MYMINIEPAPTLDTMLHVKVPTNCLLPFEFLGLFYILHYDSGPTVAFFR